MLSAGDGLCDWEFVGRCFFCCVTFGPSGQVNGTGGEVDVNLWQLCASLIMREGQGQSVVGAGFVG